MQKMCLFHTTLFQTPYSQLGEDTPSKSSPY